MAAESPQPARPAPAAATGGCAAAVVAGSGPRSSFAIEVPAALLARARCGEHAALEQIYRWFERPAFTLALRICGDREEAFEVLQDTMLKMIDRIGEFRGSSPFWGWLRQIAVNESLMRLRRHRRIGEALDLDEHEPAGDQPPPSAAADAARLQRALATLPAATRSVLWLYHAEGYTHEEIATLMERTPSFSKSQLARGSRRLRALLDAPAITAEAVHG
ncbi:sigma-70 family RNA polymerase sigma factor [Luteimonas sp. RD2P54]|uniref:Sigma-70 family RNA polymerase sigma factor n=1 Tax=Luteimonas endophytica TaxID=3042023 RepID=A0ABT6J7Z0_9GAMM|nr:sigma-70 family RNA polymerase sigma factor [Luteimonas endophytica]MDH5822948.1 sigma-70 family RNA polymerase sigma factor [Luteimonas endophytica]